MGGSVPFQLTKDWPLQFLADAGVLWIDRLPPGDGILLVDELRHRNFRKIVAFQNVQYLNQRYPTRRRRRSADDVVPAIGPTNRLTLFHVVLSKIIRADQAAAFLDVGSDFSCHGAVIKVIRILRDSFQRSSQLGLPEDFTRLIVLTIALKNAAGFAELG